MHGHLALAIGGPVLADGALTRERVDERVVRRVPGQRQLAAGQ